MRSGSSEWSLCECAVCRGTRQEHWSADCRDHRPETAASWWCRSVFRVNWRCSDITVVLRTATVRWRTLQQQLTWKVSSTLRRVILMLWRQQWRHKVPSLLLLTPLTEVCLSTPTVSTMSQTAVRASTLHYTVWLLDSSGLPSRILNLYHTMCFVFVFVSSFILFFVSGHTCWMKLTTLVFLVHVKVFCRIV